MQGYRTIIFNIAMTLAAGGTVQFSDLPPAAQHWLTLAVMAWGLVAIFLRLITKSPIGQKAEAEVETATGLSHGDLVMIINEVSRAVKDTVATMPKTAAPAGSGIASAADIAAATTPIAAPVSPAS